MASVEEMRYRAIRACPYYSTAIIRLPIVMTEQCPTMGVDKRAKCYINPQFLADLKPEHAAGILVHEIEHILCQHWRRIGVRDPGKYNIAADCIVNDRIVGYGALQIPQDGPYKGWFCKDIKGASPEMTPEEVYPLVPDQPKGQGGAATGGSCADGIDRPWETPDGGLAEIEQKMMVQQVADAVAKHRGNLPGSLKIELGLAGEEESLEDRVLRKIRTWGTNIPVGDISTYRKLSRRPMEGFVTPGRYGILPNLMLLWDTSGSMGEMDHAFGMKVFKALLGKFREIRVVAGDTHLRTAKKVFSASQIELVGGGGTDMGRMMLDAHAMDKKAAILVVTDCQTPWCDKLPVPCFALATQPHSGVPDWITTCDVFR